MQSHNFCFKASAMLLAVKKIGGHLSAMD